MVAALEYAEGDGPCPPERLQSNYIKKFGVEAVMGRPVLSAGEIRRMVMVDNIIDAYHSRMAHRDKDGAENWAEWARYNPALSVLLTEVEKIRDGE